MEPWQIPEKIGNILQRQKEIETLAIRYAKHHDIYFLGRGVLYPVALEAALKAKEIAYCNAVGYPAGEMKHGPIALISEDVPVVIFCANKRLEDKMLSNLMESKARSAPIVVFGFKSLETGYQQECNDCFFIPETSDLLSSILVSVAVQLFAYYVAKARGCVIDKPRNLAKSVTVE